MLRTIVLGCVMACGGQTPPAQPASTTTSDARLPDSTLDQDLPRLAELSVKLYQDVVAAFTAAGEDCAAAASKLEALGKIHGDVVVANAKVLKDGRAKQLKVALAAHDEQLDAAAKAIVQSPTLSKCSQDEGFARAFDMLVGAPG